MEITERRSGDVVILEFSGRLSIGDGDKVARDRIATLLAAGERKLLLGMAGVSVLDSSGVGELVAALNAAKEAGAEIRLAQLTPRVGEVLKITQLIGVFEIFDDIEKGVASFG